MVVVRHENIGDDEEVGGEVFAHLSEKKEVIFGFKEYWLPVIASVVEVIVLACDKGDFV
jgi:hypothetical protein